MKYGILSQRVISLGDGAVRKNPIQPLNAQPGMVQIGSQRVRAVFHTQERLDTVAAMSMDDWNARKQAQRQHECAAADMGMFCGHAS